MSTPGRDTVPIETPHILDSPEDVLATMTKDGKRRWLYPVESKGRFHSARKYMAWFLMVLFVAIPWIPIGGNPAIMLDFVHREFAILGLVFYPTDTILLMAFMIGILLTVVLLTALLGRVWCGWGCPQTVYLEFLFRPIERWIEGAEHVRKRRNEGPRNWDWFWRKALKISIFFGISLILAHTFVAYFVGWENLLVWLGGDPREHWGFFLISAVTTGLILYDFGYFREQMCTIACPYARMQSIMLDRDSLIVSYDPNRGEPRARRSKKVMAQEAAGEIAARGDCIDCFACVRTCPTGIDIRDGLQMECIACTQCIDACDAIMDRVDKPRGLIRYTSENILEGGSSRILRPRTFIYSALIILIFSAFTFVLTTRDAYDINIGRVVDEPFTELPDERIANRLRFRVRNQTSETSMFDIAPAYPETMEMRIVGTTPIALEPGEMTRVETWVILPKSAFEGTNLEGQFELSFSDGLTEILPYTLLGPNQ